MITKQNNKNLLNNRLAWQKQTLFRYSVNDKHIYKIIENAHWSKRKEMIKYVND